MEHQDLDALKALLVVLQAAGVARYESPDLKLEFHRLPTNVVTTSGPTALRDPIQEQLAKRRPDYASVFPQGFPTHGTPKTETE